MTSSEPVPQVGDPAPDFTLMTHNEGELNLAWYQGRKNVILASYPGQGHHLDKLENQIDFQHRMEEFYDHYLKGKPAPKWMTKGIPYLKKKSLKENI